MKIKIRFQGTNIVATCTSDYHEFGGLSRALLANADFAFEQSPDHETAKRSVCGSADWDIQVKDMVAWARSVGFDVEVE